MSLHYFMTTVIKIRLLSEQKSSLKRCDDCYSDSNLFTKQMLCDCSKLFFALVDTSNMICTETRIGRHVKVYFFDLIFTKIGMYQQML